jgi:hypothetical protein
MASILPFTSGYLDPGTYSACSRYIDNLTPMTWDDKTTFTKKICGRFDQIPVLGINSDNIWGEKILIIHILVTSIGTHVKASKIR